MINEAIYDSFDYESEKDLKKIWTADNKDISFSVYGLEKCMLIPKGTSVVLSKQPIKLNEYNAIKVRYSTLSSYKLGFTSYVDGLFYDVSMSKELKATAVTGSFNEVIFRLPSVKDGSLMNVQFKNVAFDTFISKISLILDNSFPNLEYNLTNKSATISYVSDAKYAIFKDENNIKWTDERSFFNLKSGEEYYLGIKYSNSSEFEKKKIIIPSFSFLSIYKSHMVLRRNKEIKIVGYGDSDKEYTLSFNGQNVLGIYDNGEITFNLSPMKECVTGKDIIVTNNGVEIARISDILVGEVYIVSGQSNMEFPLLMSDYDETDFSSLSSNKLRIMEQPIFHSNISLKDFNENKWEVASKENIYNFSAIGIMFGAMLLKSLKNKIPIGIIYASEGGTEIRSWMSERVELKNKLELDHIDYNAMISPIESLNISGFIWYQGENDAEKFRVYKDMLTLFISDLKKTFNDDLNIYIIQLPLWNHSWSTNYPFIREAQSDVASELSNCNLIVTIDGGDPNDIHPRNKRYIAVRLLEMVLYKEFGKKKVYYTSWNKEEPIKSGNTISVTFTSSVHKTDVDLSGFEIAGVDLIFYPATGFIDHEKAVLLSSEVKSPQYVRYNFLRESGGNLYNSFNYPVVPFRTNRNSSIVIDDFTKYKDIKECSTTKGFNGSNGLDADNYKWFKNNVSLKLDKGFLEITSKTNNASITKVINYNLEGFHNLFIDYKSSSDFIITLTLKDKDGLDIYPSVSLKASAKESKSLISFEEFMNVKDYVWSISIKCQIKGSKISIKRLIAN